MPDRSSGLLQGPEGFSPPPHLPVRSCQSTSDQHHLRNRSHVVKIPGNYGGNVFVEKQHRVLGGVGGNPAGSDGWDAS